MGSSLQPIAVQRALKESSMSMRDIDGVAFTRGPGELRKGAPCSNH